MKNTMTNGYYTKFKTSSREKPQIVRENPLTKFLQDTNTYLKPK